ncbi:MAG: DUF6465 family protein [Firmicutes bacterium]|nr:DUF6465 family protein [Bacillota bacterium]
MAPRKKTTPAVDTEVKTEAAVEAEKKPAAKKTTKAAAKSTARTTKAAAAKKTAAAEVKQAEPAVKAEVAAPAAPKTEVFVEYGGAQVSVDEVISNARKIVGDDKDIKIYVQPDTSKAYIAFNGESVSMDVFFCK